MSTQAQSWTLYRGEDCEIVLTGEDDTDPTGWALQFSVGDYPGQPDADLPLKITSGFTVGGSGPYTITVPFTRAQTSALSRCEYHADLWRRDSGAAVRLAGGRLRILTPVYPPA